MFKAIPNPTFEALIKLTVPGQETPAVVTFKFRHKGRKALKAWIDRAAEKPDEATLAEVVADWDGVCDAEDRALPFSEAALAQLLDAYPAAGGELFGGYLVALTESRAKN